MPPATKEQRRQSIVELVGSHAIRSQAELAKLLGRRGHRVNQATLSRDLRDLGLRKGPAGYELPHDGDGTPTEASDLGRAVREWLLDAIPAQNQVVLTTPPGGAQPLAFALDHTPLAGVVGTLAGDDTVLVVCQTARAAARLAKQMTATKGAGA